MSKSDRLEAVNELIWKISSLSRRFFYCKRFDRMAKFYISNCRGSNIMFVDDFTGKVINVRHHMERWRNFSHGGTMKGLITSLADHIQTGRKLHFIVGYCFSEENMWGYEEADVKEIKKLAAELGITEVKK